MHSSGALRREIERAYVLSSLKIESDVRNSASWTVSFILALEMLNLFWTVYDLPRSRQERWRTIEWE
jgi:hypothetical protein